MVCPAFHSISKKNIFLAMALFLAIAGFPLLTGLGASYLVITSETGEIAWSAPIKDGENFQLRYIHSVDRLPVFDTFSNRKSQLILEETRFRSMGIGLGYMNEGVFCGENGWMIIKNMQRPIGTLPLRVAITAEQTLLYRGREIRLRDHLPAQALVHIGIKRSIPIKLYYGGRNYDLGKKD